MKLPSERGSALVELAMVTPVLALMLFGIVDYGRALYTAAALTNAARAGAQYAAQQVAFNAADAQTKAQAASSRITYTVDTPVRLLACADNSTGVVTTGTCTTSQHQISFVKVTARSTFTTVSTIPGIPKTSVMIRSATYRLD